jgi:hypothetical protein
MKYTACVYRWRGVIGLPHRPKDYAQREAGAEPPPPRPWRGTSTPISSEAGAQLRAVGARTLLGMGLLRLGSLATTRAIPTVKVRAGLRGGFLPFSRHALLWAFPP